MQSRYLPPREYPTQRDLERWAAVEWAWTQALEMDDLYDTLKRRHPLSVRQCQVLSALYHERPDRA